MIAKTNTNSENRKSMFTSCENEYKKSSFVEFCFQSFFRLDFDLKNDLSSLVSIGMSSNIFSDDVFTSSFLDCVRRHFWKWR